MVFLLYVQDLPNHSTTDWSLRLHLAFVIVVLWCILNLYHFIKVMCSCSNQFPWLHFVN